MYAPKHNPSPLPRLRAGTRAGRTAVSGRRAHARWLRYASLWRIFATVAALTLAVVIYLGLMANVTRMNYDLAKRLALRAGLIDETSRLDDRIARLSSRERLGLLAAKLGMGEPQTFAAIALPLQPAATGHGLAFLDWLK